MGDREDIRDDELRILGSSVSLSGTGHSKKRRWWLWIIVAVCLITAGVALVVRSCEEDNEPATDAFDPSSATVMKNAVQDPLTFIGDYTDTVTAYTEVRQRIVNDIPLDIYIPHNATPKLFLGVPDINDDKIIFATQAADVRADNWKINGAFVLAGKPLAWGLSKKGFVAIIDGKITVGVADNSPLFEKATETGGYFFRQYALVDNGVLVENEPKNKSIRKAVCDRGGEIIIVMSQTKESFHDFAQALVDLRVDNAVYVVGSVSYSFYSDIDKKKVAVFDRLEEGYRNENYILWETSIVQERIYN